MAKKYLNYLSYPIGLFVALIVFSVTLLLLGYDPISALVSIPTGAFGNPNSLSETLIRFIPLLLTAMAFLIALKARFMNLGVEGQLYIGALLAYLVGARMEIVPSFIAIPLIFIAGFMGGVLWLAIPLIMKNKLGVNEIFPTVVMNYIAMFVIAWLTIGPLKDPTSFNPRTPFLPESTWLPLIDPIFISYVFISIFGLAVTIKIYLKWKERKIHTTQYLALVFTFLTLTIITLSIGLIEAIIGVNGVYRLYIGVFIVVIIALIIYMILYKTTIGYKIRAVGQNPRASEHGGVNVKRIVITAGLLSGGIAGLAGFMEVFGVHHYLIRGFSPGFGYQGIAVAALGIFHPIGAIFAALFFAVLQIGGESMQRGAGIPVDIIFIMQAVLVLTVLIVKKWMTTRNSS
ncbi:MAG: ABC transporter permease [Candidatus Kariarchaeaceae archaeon]|jgi:simple sugar transport system permease protein